MKTTIQIIIKIAIFPFWIIAALACAPIWIVFFNDYGLWERVFIDEYFNLD